MRKLAAALMLVGVALMTVSAAPVDAGFDYPPQGGVVQVVQGSPGPVNGSFQVRVQGCEPGEQVRFTLPANNQPPVVVVCSASGVATAALAHPSTPGTYTGTAVLVGSGITLSFSIVTTADPGTGPLPPTGGGSSSNTLVLTGVGLLALGAGLVGVAGYRRRRPALA